MYEYKSKYYPSADELPDSDETPVDNELQNTIPGLLKAILAFIWAERWDWFFGIDMGIYYDPDEPAIIPDGFLGLGVERVFHEDLRRSYALWEERVPTIILEVVSQKYRGEYSRKKQEYANMGALYYVIYHPYRRRKPRLEVHRLVESNYVLQHGNPLWLPEVGLGIGYERGTYLGITREWLYWYDEQGVRYPTPEERAQQAELRARQAEQRAMTAEERARLLEERLRSLGIDPDSLI